MGDNDQATPPAAPAPSARTLRRRRDEHRHFKEDITAARTEIVEKQQAEQLAAARTVRGSTEMAYAERAQMAFELRRRGAPYAAILKALNAAFPDAPPMTRLQLGEMVRIYIDALDRDTREPTRIVKRLEIERLDGLLFGTSGKDGLYERARVGEGDAKQMAAIDRFLAVQKRRLDILGIPIDKLIVEGGDTPLRVEDPVTALYIALQKQLQARRAVRDINTPPATAEAEPEGDDDGDGP